MAMDMSVTAIIAADVAGFMSGIQSAKGALEGLQKNSDGLGPSIGDSMRAAGSAVSGLGTALTAGLTVPLAAVGKASVGTFADFDSALIGVAKTTGYTGKELDSFGKEILAMTREMPVSAVELANLAEGAAQLGIKTTEGGRYIKDFVKVTAQMGTATNMSSEQAANAMARIANITQMPQTEFHRLGSTIVALGNNMATTESEITEMGLRLAGTGSQVGLSEAQIMGLAAAMSSVGINAEAGGSAFSRVMQKMNTSVLSGTEELQGFASVAGKTADEFAEQWKSNPQAAITDFVKGLGRVKDSGGDVTQTLKDLGIQSVQEIDTLARLAGAGDLLGESFDIANGAWKDGTALSKEAEAAYQSFSNKLEKLKNALTEAGIAIGGVLAPHIEKAANFIKGLVDKFNNLSQSSKEAIVGFGMVAAAIGPAIFAIGKMISAAAGVGRAFSLIGSAAKLLSNPFGSLMGWFTKLNSGGSSLSFAWAQLVGWFTKMGGATGLLQSALSLLMSPITAIIAGIALFIAAIIRLWNTNEEFRQKVMEIWNNIKDFFATAGEFLQPLIDGFKNAWDIIVQTIQTAWDNILNVINIAIDFIGSIIMVFMSVLTGDWEAAWRYLGEALQNAWNLIVAMLTTAWELLKGVFDAGVAIIKGVWDTFWQTLPTGIQEVFSGIGEFLSNWWTMITTVFQAAWDIIVVIFETVLAIIKALVEGDFGQIKEILSNAWDQIKEKAEIIWNAILEFLQQTWEQIKAAAQTAWENLKTTVETIIENLKTAITNKWNEIKTSVENTVENIKSAVTNKWNEIKSSIDNTVNEIKNSVTNKWNEIKSSVTNIANELVNAAKQAWENLKSSVSDAVSNVKSTFDGLRNIDLFGAGQAIIQGFLNGIKSAFESVKSFVGGIADWIKANKGPIQYDRKILIPAGNAIMTGLNKGLKSGFKGVQSNVSTMAGRIVDNVEGVMNDISSAMSEGLSFDQTLRGMINGSVQTQVDVDLGKHSQPMQVNLALGNRDYSTFVSDITDKQNAIARLEEAY